jgi:PBP1b-binding outer membrane lipoprotein LpoB
MKHIAVLILALFIFGGCSSDSKNRDAAGKYTAAQQEPGIVDEEYDLLVAPQYDYDNVPPYEQQIKAQPAAAKKNSSKTAKPKAYKQD